MKDSLAQGESNGLVAGGLAEPATRKDVQSFIVLFEPDQEAEFVVVGGACVGTPRIGKIEEMHAFHVQQCFASNSGL